MATKLNSSQIYDLAVKAGFDPKGAKTMTAIVMAESGGSPNVVGDHNNPGPGASSVGLAQINFLPGRDEGNANRDPKANLDPLTNLQHAYKISNGGTNFNAWSTYTTNDPKRSYKQFMPDANTAAGGMKNSGTAGSTTGSKPLTDSQILASLKTTAPWLYATYTNPAFTSAQKKVFVGWARDAAIGKVKNHSASCSTPATVCAMSKTPGFSCTRCSS